RLRDDVAGRSRRERRGAEADRRRATGRGDHRGGRVGPRNTQARAAVGVILPPFLPQTLRIAIPYPFPPIGGVVSERSGLIALGLEGYMLGGAFCGAVASYYSGSPWIGLLGAIGGGAALALLYAVTAIRFRADQVVVGIAVNLLVTGATRFFLRLAFHSSANSPRVPGFGGEQSGTGLSAL